MPMLVRAPPLTGQEVNMSRRLRILAGLAGVALAGSLVVVAQSANAQVEPGPWKPANPGFKVQQFGCGKVNGLTFQLTCGNKSGQQRAERRYETYSSGTHQFEGDFKITSMGGSRISLKQTFKTSGPFFLLAVEHGGRLYAVENGNTLGSGATVGTTVRVNTVHTPGQNLKVYINGSLKGTFSSPKGSYYDKFGAYRTGSGYGPITVQWSNIQFWTK